MDSTERVMKMEEKKAMPPIFEKLNTLRKDGHLEQQMYEDLRVMVAGYFFYRDGVEIMSARLGVQEGAVGCHFPEVKE